jgi:hypothetical protein
MKIFKANITDIAALWGAVIATLLAFWCRVYTIDKRQQTFGANVE